MSHPPSSPGHLLRRTTASGRAVLSGPAFKGGRRDAEANTEPLSGASWPRFPPASEQNGSLRHADSALACVCVFSYLLCPQTAVHFKADVEKKMNYIYSYIPF